MVDNYGVCSDNAGPFVWEVGIKLLSDVSQAAHCISRRRETYNARPLADAHLGSTVHILRP